MPTLLAIVFDPTCARSSRVFARRDGVPRAMLAVLILMSIAPAWWGRSASAQPVTSAAPGLVSTRTLLEEMVDRSSIARFPSPTFTLGQFSSYDRASVTPTDAAGWFANMDTNQYLRVEENAGRREFVMMDAKGPGAVVRFWSANPKGTLRVYLDDAATPVIEAPMEAVLSGTWKFAPPLSHVGSNGRNLYFPIAYASRCKITSDADGFYYQINHRTYPANTPIRSFSMNDLETELPTITVVQESLRTPPRGASDPVVLHQGEIAPGAKVSKGLPFGPAAVNRLWVTLDAPDVEQALRTTIIRIEFDGDQTVWCPVGEFFGGGVGFNPFDSWYTAAKGENQLISRWTMPYRQRATITLENLGQDPVTATLAHRSSQWRWDDRSMHFHTTWRHEDPIRTRPYSDWNFVTVTGRGVYVGDALTILNPVPEWWGEGDEKITVDGEAFPSHFGTGTEDYYGYAWSSPKKFQHAFHGQTRSDGEASGTTRGYSSVFRTRALDVIPFAKSIDVDMEVWHWVDCEVAYAATTFFYAIPEATTNREPQPGEASKGVRVLPPPPPPFKIEGMIEAESMSISGVTKAKVVTQDMQGFGRGKWSNEQQVWVQGEGVGAGVTFELFVDPPGPRRLIVHATKSWDYATVRFTVNGKPAGADVDLFSGQVNVSVPTGTIDLGVFEPINGKFELRAEVVGANAAATGTKAYFGIDGVVMSAAK
jgi:Protein of unknown function (DUF2961)